MTIKDPSRSNLIDAIKSLAIKATLLTYVAPKLGEEISKCFSVEDYVDLSYNFHLKLKLPFIRNMFSIQPAQIKEEIVQLLSVLAGVRPRVLLEIGTAKGGHSVPLLSDS